jgi:hypothetical protein
MKSLKNLSLLALASLTACARIPAPSFEMTNPVILEKAVKEINISNMISNHVPAGSRVALIPVANNDINIKDFYMIEDNLTQQLLLGGYVVKQKPDALTLSAAGEVERPELTSVTVEGSIDRAGQTIQIAKQDSDVTLPPSNWDRIKAIVPDVDAYIVYNIHEYGLIYIPNESAMKMITREFRVKMNVRVVSARDLSVLAVKDYNAQKSDDIHQSTLSALNEFNYKSSAYTFPLLDDGSARDGKWLRPATHDWDFVFSGGMSFPQKMYLLRGGIDSDFGRLMVNMTAFNMSSEYDGKTEDVNLNGFFENLTVSFTYLKRIKSWNQVSVLVGGGPAFYAGGDVGTQIGGATPKLYGVQGAGELEYSFYRSNAIRATLSAGATLNLMIPYIKEIENKDLTITSQLFSPYATVGIIF